ncbi:hypothetical protein [Burkholderia anthina]|uniref:Uncharacterized protein n=1 Tax=Burkholderia anthina TaxID=179879 RepID=A0ABS2B6D5_9BURK|nr:hypothetical protein [Burkholderia anthina]MBM2767859.1 hypothetical protein [Burkholderia anthina]
MRTKSMTVRKTARRNGRTATFGGLSATQKIPHGRCDTLPATTLIATSRRLARTAPRQRARMPVRLPAMPKQLRSARIMIEAR